MLGATARRPAMAPRGLLHGPAVCGVLGVLWCCGALGPPAPMELWAHCTSLSTPTALRPTGLAVQPLPDERTVRPPEGSAVRTPKEMQQRFFI